MTHSAIGSMPLKGSSRMRSSRPGRHTGTRSRVPRSRQEENRDAPAPAGPRHSNFMFITYQTRPPTHFLLRQYDCQRIVILTAERTDNFLLTARDSNPVRIESQNHIGLLAAYLV